MKVLFLSTWFPYPPDNGSKLRVYHLLRALGQAHEVSLLSFAFATARPEHGAPLAQWCAGIEVAKVDPFAVNQASALRTYISLRPMASRPVMVMSRLVSGTMQGQRFDAVIASTEMMADYALLLPVGATKVLEEHNSMVRWARERYEAAEGPLARSRCWLSWKKSRWNEAHLFPRFDLVTMVSELDRAATMATVGLRGPQVEVVPNGVDCVHNRPGLAQPQPASLVFNGSLTYSANYDAMRWFLAQVYPRIRAEVPEVTLTITGSTQGADLTGLNVDDSVTLTGFVQDVRLPVAGAAVAVAPIRQGGGTRLKILEAMALGTPVVATSKGAEGLDVADREHLLLADDPQRFAERVVVLLADAGLRARLAANARRLVEQRYDWQTIGGRFVELVEASVEARGRRAS